MLVIPLGAALLVGACSRQPVGAAPTPQPCAALFPAARCEAMLDRVASELGVPGEDIAAMDVLPDPTPEVRDGMVILQARSGGPPVYVRATLADGNQRDVLIGCGGISAAYDPACMDDPHLIAYSITGPGGGYRDLPCATEDGGGCATPLPNIDPSAVAKAEPVRLDRLVIPIGHLGRQEVVIGDGSLPNGVLTEASFTFVDDWPTGLSLSGDVFLDVRSLEPDGRPFDNYYTHGWREGIERIEAVLVFEVRRFDPGAVLAIRDVVVR